MGVPCRPFLPAGGCERLVRIHQLAEEDGTALLIVEGTLPVGADRCLAVGSATEGRYGLIPWDFRH
ncbi:hypothetical protein AB0L40_24125 [Patulibacter sp. NPDC049589]|uniref:hypothetical protein n=1 Tax=Patulibacter sp. NPDC049589 TaxID=3154731 RepID=UPI0034493B1D